MGDMFGGQTQTTTTTIPQAGGQETAILNLLQKLSTGAAGQLGDLSALASGDISRFGPTGADQEIIAKSIEAARQMGQRQAESMGAQLSAKMREDMAARGMQGSSAEFVGNVGMGNQLQSMIMDMINQAQMQGGQALMNLPFQRANTALNANQALFQQIAGTATPLAQSLLQNRMAQGTQTTQMPTDWANIMKVGGALGAAPFTGGASLGILGMPTQGSK